MAEVPARNSVRPPIPTGHMEPPHSEGRNQHRCAIPVSPPFCLSVSRPFGACFVLRTWEGPAPGPAAAAGAVPSLTASLCSRAALVASLSAPADLRPCLLPSEGETSTLAGSGEPGFADGKGGSAKFHFPQVLALQRRMTLALTEAPRGVAQLWCLLCEVPEGSLRSRGEGHAADVACPCAIAQGVGMSHDGAVLFVVSDDGRLSACLRQGDARAEPALTAAPARPPRGPAGGQQQPPHPRGPAGHCRGDDHRGRRPRGPRGRAAPRGHLPLPLR